ncbi:hypothetical protein GCM10011351_06690 [Paraliobacillus quinghaiensis]|uniref:GGDEF domain-containing protein n=1 Tax=Paraliobacillus quinghaiensis TaxID=470815 RepID=A0A917WQP6_9BACI|nr:sensor domain-containing diguanylate cyclase [Paraliobacillus quinghaiensis]GGM23578.1 hypothetical protein GCM10011351_06690 [Paraliobacillus quinghaiensis]
MSTETFFLIFIGFSIFLAVFVNYIRFKVTTRLNKLFLIMSFSLLIVLQEYFFEVTSILTIISLIIISTFSFQIYVGLIISGVVAIYLALFTTKFNLFLLFTFIVLSIGTRFFTIFINKRKNEQELYKKLLVKNSKELNVYREVSIMMQRTYELERILKIIVTSVTAGHGLGFNRAMILLVINDGTRVQGKLGVGPMTADEGFVAWELITKNRYRLIDLIEMQDEDDQIDPQLNKLIKELDIKLEKGNFLFNALENEMPYIMNEIDKSDEIQSLFARLFNMEEFAVFPLITQGVKVGVLIIDNPVNKKPITSEAIDSVIPMANQAAIAIQQSHLYKQVENMAWKDGLTGLLNQRAFQTISEKYIATARKEALSLIMLDIDYFKNFNDTNGHLQGNQALIQVAQIIEKSVRKDDYAFRFGGEEFVILLPKTNEPEATAIAERIRVNIQEEKFQGGDKQPFGMLTVSLGVASTANLKTVTTNKLIETADQVLYEAKVFGRNNVKSYTELI